MNLIHIFRKECVAAGAKATDKQDVLRQIAALARQTKVLQAVSEEILYAALLEREALGSTGFGNGIAIPHCRLSGVNEFVMGILSLPEGVDFGALDGEPVKLIVFIVAPDTRSDEHIRLLSTTSQILSIPGAVDEMVREPTAVALQESFLRHAFDEVEKGSENNFSLFHVLVQKEDYFLDLLQIFGSLEQGSTVVLDADHSTKYLSKMPMFSAFWTDEPAHFCRVIVATVNKKMINEIIRRVERVTGKLSENSGVLLMVQELFYCAGSLTD